MDDIDGCLRLSTCIDIDDPFPRASVYTTSTGSMMITCRRSDEAFNVRHEALFCCTQ